MPNMGLYRRAPAPKRVKRHCRQCGHEFEPRLADVNRGWGNFCTKRCKALYQVSKKSQPKQKPQKQLKDYELEQAAVQANFNEWDRICAEEDGLLTT